MRPDAGGLVAGALPVGAFLLLAAIDGGFAVTLWLPVALLILAQTVVLAFAWPRLLVGVPRTTLLAIALFAAFTAWSFLSITWADGRGAAWEGANRTLFYGTVFALFALWPWRSETAATLLGFFALGVAAIGTVAFVAVARSSNPGEHFIGGLFVEPVGYHNASAALFLLPFWPALLLASRRELPAVVRGVLLGTAALLAELSLLAQSRGSIVAFAISAALFFAIVPRRTRALLALLPVGLAVVLSLPELLDVYREVGGEAHDEAMSAAGRALASSFAALVAFGLVWAVVDRRITLTPRVSGVASRSLGALSLGVVIAALVMVAPADPRARAASAWDEFRAGYRPESEPATSHFTKGLGTNRYDFWRVALGEFREAPIAGIGADNFEIPYLRERRSDEEPLYPHSIEVQVLSQTGLLGSAAFLAFVAAAIFAASRAWTLDPFGRAVAASAAVACAYWAAHGSVDWLWEVPALGAPALACLGMAAGLARPRPRDESAVRGGVLLLVPAAAAAVSLVLPWLAVKQTQAAAAVWSSDPELAFDRIERARRLNPLAEHPDLVAGAIASRLGDLPRMRTSFEDALARNPQSWYAELELALAAAVSGRREAALHHLERAETLNPREPAIGLLRRRLQARRPVSPEEIDRLFLTRLEDRTR